MKLDLQAYVEGLVIGRVEKNVWGIDDVPDDDDDLADRLEWFARVLMASDSGPPSHCRILALYALDEVRWLDIAKRVREVTR